MVRRLLRGDAAYFAVLAERLANRTDLRTIEAFVTPTNVQQLFREAAVPAEFDVLSIDVDGQDYWIWEVIDEFRPRVVVVEYNAALPAGERLVEGRGRTGGWMTLLDFFGASMGAMRALGEHKGYALVHAELAGVNALFVRDDLAGHFDVAPPARGPNFELLGHRHGHYEGGEVYEQVSPGDVQDESVGNADPVPR